MAVCRAQPGIANVRAEGGRISFTADEPAVAELSQALVEAGALIRSLAPQSVTLEDLFFSLTEGNDGKDGVATAAALSQALVESGALIRAMAPETVTLEDLFFELTEGDAPAPEPVPAEAAH